MQSFKQIKQIRILFSFAVGCSISIGSSVAQEHSSFIEQQTVSHPTTSSSVETVKSVFNPKFKQRIQDLGDQVHANLGKGFITQAEADKFEQRLQQLSTLEAEVKKNGYPKAGSDELEKGITALNADVFKAARKDNPVKPGQAEKEVNDPNLIPAYPDKDLQPGSGMTNQSTSK